MPKGANITKAIGLPLIPVPDEKGGTPLIDVGLLDRPPQGSEAVEQTSLQAGRKAVLRCFKTPDGSRVVTAGLLYEDLSVRYPDDTWDIPETPLPPLYEIQKVEGKGRGMIATRDIKRGETIVRERPVLLCPARIFGTLNSRYQQMNEDLSKILEMLESEDRDKFLQLHNCKSPDECGSLAGIARTNAFLFPVPDSEICARYSLVCLNISYANHSCNPNAYNDSDICDPICTLLAYRDISKGEEITISYIHWSNSRTKRQTELLRIFGFICTCEECSKPLKPIINKSLTSILEEFTIEPSRWRAIFDGHMETLKKVRRFVNDMKNTKKLEYLTECLDMRNDVEVRRMWADWLQNPTSTPMEDSLTNARTSAHS